jgi:acyl-CoA thioesterase-2
LRPPSKSFYALDFSISCERQLQSTTWSQSMTTAVQDLLALLDLEQLEVNLFRGRSPQQGWQRVFGGQVIGQALVAACRTVDDVAERPPHSLHAYFLLPGDPKVPIIYEVDRIRDGRSFVTRRVVAIQHGNAIFSMSVSFQVVEEGLSHMAEMPDVPDPESLPSDNEIKSRVLPIMPDPVRRYYERERPIELRPVEFERYLGKKFPNGRFNVWIRATGPLPDAAAIHQCVLAYASDLTLLDAALVPHGRTVFEKGIMAASLDHALWFHRPFRADDWLLYAQESPNASGARGFARGLIFSRNGTLVASVAQEGLIREKREAIIIAQTMDKNQSK